MFTYWPANEPFEKRRRHAALQLKGPKAAPVCHPEISAYFIHWKALKGQCHEIFI